MGPTGTMWTSQPRPRSWRRARPASTTWRPASSQWLYIAADEDYSTCIMYVCIRYRYLPRAGRTSSGRSVARICSVSPASRNPNLDHMACRATGLTASTKSVMSWLERHLAVGVTWPQTGRLWRSLYTRRMKQSASRCMNSDSLSTCLRKIKRNS